MNFIQENKRRWVLVKENIVSRGKVKFSLILFEGHLGAHSVSFFQQSRLFIFSTSNHSCKKIDKFNNH